MRFTSKGLVRIGGTCRPKWAMRDKTPSTLSQPFGNILDRDPP